MNKIRSFFTLLLLMIGLCLSTLQAKSYNSLWKQVEQAQKKSLPQTVVKLTGQIYRKAEQEKNVPQMLKNLLGGGGRSGGGGGRIFAGKPIRKDLRRIACMSI